MLSREERYKGKRYAALALMMQDFLNGNTEGLHLAYEQAKINNTMLVKRLKKDRSVAFMPQKMIFMDMCVLLFELSENDTSIIHTLQDYYRRRYPDVARSIQRVEQSIDIIRSYEKAINSTGGLFKRVVFMFLSYDEDVINEKGLLEVFHKDFCSTVNFSYLVTDKDIFSLQPVNFNTDEPILESKVFRRWIVKRKQALADYLSETTDHPVSVQNLNEELHDLFCSHADANNTIISTDDAYFSNWMSRNIMANHHGGWMWIDSITNDGKTGYHTPIGYKPDMDFLIEMYYKIVVAYHNSVYTDNNGKGMTKVYLSRELETNPHDDIVSLGYIYNLDVVTKLFDDMVEEYYKNFSWERITQKALAASYENVISRLTEQIEILKSRLDNITQENANVRKQILQSSNAAVIPFEKENAALSKRLAQKDEEIIALKRQLQSQNEYLDLVMNAEEEELEEINVEALQKKRYLFVGFKGQITNELRKQFSNSVFMDSETFNLNGIQVDAVVMLISIMNHAMFYKVNSTAALEGLPVVRVNTRNLNTIYREMVRALSTFAVHD